MLLHVTDNLRKIAKAAGFDVDRYYRENIRPANENPADAPEDPYWPDTSDLDAEKGCKTAVRLKVKPTKTFNNRDVYVEGWELAEGFWIGRYRFKQRHISAYQYTAGRSWSDIYEG